MIDKLVSSILASKVGEFVEGINQDSVKISILSGEFTMKNPALRSDALDSLELPITIESGFLGLLKFKLPWSSLTSQPAIVQISDLYALAGPRQQQDEKEQETRVQGTKQRLLQLTELLAGDEEEQEKNKEQGYFANLQATVVNNLQVEINNVHIRYQDTDRHGKPFAMGITIEQFTARSCNSKWEEEFVNPQESKKLFKIVKMKNFSMYWDTTGKRIAAKSKEQIGRDLQALIHTAKQPQKGITYILAPVNFDLQVSMNQEDNQESHDDAKIFVDCVCKQVAFCLDEKQYEQMINLVESFRNYSKSIRYIHYRPSSKPEKKPLDWWKYVIRSARKDYRDHNKFRNWKSIVEFIQDRNRYIYLFSQKKLSTVEKSITISDEEIQELTDLEWKHTYEDIALFRVISRAYFKKNKEHVAQAKREKEQEQKKDQGFFSRLLHIGPTVKVEPLKITPSLIQELQDGLSQAELDSVQQESHLQDEFAQQKLRFTLENGSFDLRDSKREHLLRAGFSGLNLRVEKRGESITIKTSLGSVDLADHFTKNTVFPRLIEPNSSADTVLSGQFDVKPADNKDLDYRVAVRMEPLNVIMSKPLMNRVIKFVSEPLLSKNSFRDLELAATIKFQQLKQQTQLQFKEMLGEQKAIDLNIDVAAPNVIIPHKPDDKESSLLILVLGQMTVRSDLDSVVEAMKDAHANDADEDAASEIMLYKKFNIDLKQIHALMVTAEEFRQHGIDNIPREKLLIDHFDVAVSLDLCRAHSEKLALLKLDASFPELKGYLSSGKVTHLLLIVDALTASEDSGENPKDMSLDKLLEQVARQESEKEGEQEQISTNERFVKASFSIPRASVLLEDDSASPYLPVAELRLQKTEGTFEFNSHDMNLSLSLDATNVIDHVQQKGEQYKYLATSELENRGISDSMSSLLTESRSKQSVLLKYHGIPKNSPLFEDLAHDVQMEFGMFHAMCNVLTLNHLLSLLNRAFDDYDKQRVLTSAQVIEQKNPDKVNDARAAEIIQKKKDEDFTLVKFNAVFKSFGVSFPRKGEMMMEIFMSQSVIHVDMTDSNYLHVDGKLGAMKVNYNNDTVRELYPDIMGIRGDDLIHFTVNYQLGPEHLPLPKDADKHTIPLDALVKLELNSVQFNYVQVFIEDLVDYFITSQAMVQEAHSDSFNALAQRAEQLQKATAAAANETNFGYDVTIHNPILFMPRSQTSREGMKADLGKIHICNRFFKQRKDGHKFIREDISIDITDCTLLSCLLGSDDHDQAILKNTDIHLHVIQTKNDEDHLFPGMSVDVDIPSIGVQVSEYQMKLLRSILEDNISSEMKSKQIKSHEDLKNISVEKLRAAQLADVVHEDGDIMQSEEENEIIPAELPTPYLDIYVDVKIDQIQAEILLGNGYDPSAGITPLGTEPLALDRSAPSTSLISGDVRLLKTEVHMFSDGSMDVDLTMQDLFMRDARHADNGNLFKDIFTTRLKKSLPLSQPYFQLKYNQAANSYQKVDIKIYHPSLIFVPDIWIDLAIFILPFNDDILGSVNAFTSFWSEFSPKLTPNKEQEPDKPQVPRMEGMEVSLFMIDAQMCILADGKKKDSHTLLVQSDMDIIYSTSSEERKDKFLLKSRRIETTRSRMNNLKNSVPIVEPFRVGFQYLDNQASHICSIEAGVETINATFTYRDILVMQKIAEKWWPEINRYLTKDEKKEDGEKDKKDKEDSEEESSERMEVSPQRETEVDKPKVTQEARFSIRGARLVLVDDSNDQVSQRPLIRIQADDCFTEVKDWEYDLNATAQTRVSISNYNDQLELWEEMLEPWDTAMKYNVENGVSTIKVTNKPININISKSFVEACLLTISSITEEFEKDSKADRALKNAEVVEEQEEKEEKPVRPEVKEDVEEKEKPMRHPFTIVNETGIPMTYVTSEINAVPHRLKEQQETPVIFTDSSRPVKNAGYAHDWKERLESLNKTLTVQMQDPKHLFEKADYGLPIDRIGKYKLRLTGRRDEAGHYLNGATFEVKSHRGDKVLVVRSNVLFINHTDADLQLLFASDGASDDVRSLPPGKTISAPLYFTESGQVQFMNHGAISQKKFERKDMDRERVILMNCIHPEKELFFNLHIKPENQDVIVTLSAPVVMENYLPANLAFQFGHPKSHLSYSKKMEKGEKLYLLDLNPQQPMLLSLSIHLYGRCQQPVDMKGFASQERLFEFHDQKGRSLKVRMSVVLSDNKIITITFYCDMWIVNKTKLPLLFGPDHRNEISGGLVEVEEKLPKYQGIPSSDWFSDPHPKEGHMYTAEQGMFSRSEKVHLRIANSEWSAGVAIGAEGQQGQIFIKTPPQGPKKVVSCYPLAVTVQSGPGQFWRTKKVIVMPRYRMWNNTGSDLYYMQKDTKSKCPPFKIQAGQCVPFYWPREDSPFFRLNLEPEKWLWGGAISFAISGERSIKLRARDEDLYKILCLSFKLDSSTGSTIIAVTECEQPDYLIQNKTPYTIQVRQKGHKTRDVILPDTEVPYAWDDYDTPDTQPQLSLLIDDATTEEHLSLDIFGQKEIMLPGKPRVTASVLPRKATKVLELSMRPIKKKTKKGEKRLDLSETAAIWETLQMKAIIHVDYIGVSVIDNTPREIMFVSISQVQVVAQDSLTDQSVEVVVERFQVDNQLPGTPFPVALWPVIPPQENNERSAFFHMAVIRNKMVTSVMFIRDFLVSVGAMELCLDESFITECLDFAQLIMNYMSTAEKSKSQARQLEDVNEVSEEEELKQIENTKTEVWYFQTLQINPLAMTLTMNMDGVDREDLNRLIGFGRTFCNIDSASFQLAGLLSEHTYSNANDLMNQLTAHYMHAGMTQMAKFIFGAEILGSPISLVSNLGTGVKDFFAEPAQGFTRSPAEFGVGIARGTTSLVKNTTVGIFNATSKFTGAVASGAAALSFDQQYQLERDKSRVREKPRHAGQGLRYGAKAFGKGLWSGVSGVVSSPVRGANEEGFSGAMKGLARGAAGVVVKPTVGAIDSVSRFTEGIKNTATLWDDEKKQRARLPRFIGPDKAIRSFDQEKARGQERLRSLDDERFARDWFHSQYQLREGHLIVTNRTLIYLDRSDNVQWFAPVHGIRGLQLTSAHILVYLKMKNKAKTFQRSSAEKLIELPTSKSNTLPQVYQELKEYLDMLRNDRRFQVR